jgi:hypothetical protein
MRQRLVSAFCLSLTCIAWAPGASADVSFNAEQRNAAGIETRALETASVPRVWAATAQVLDAAPLIGLAGDLRAAQAASAGSRHELERSERLYAAESNVSLRTVESARAQAITDEGHVGALKAQLAASWGRVLANMGDAPRDRLMGELAAGHIVLLRAETRRVDSGSPHFTRARVSLIAGGRSWNADVLGPAAPATTPAVGDLYLLSAPAAPGLEVGRALTAQLQDASEVLHGVKVPLSAVLRWQGSDWVFIETSANHFARRRIVPEEWLDDGCLVGDALRAGERIVTVGAEVLLAADTGSMPSSD